MAEPSPHRHPSRRPRFTTHPLLPRLSRRPRFLPIAIPVDLRLILPVYSPFPSAIPPSSPFPPSSFSPAASFLPHRHPRVNLMDEPEPNTPADVTRWNSELRKLDKIPSRTTAVAFMNSQEYYAVPILQQNQPNSESLAGHNIQSIEQGPGVRYEQHTVQNPRRPASRPQPRRTEAELDDDDFVNPPNTSSRPRKRTAEASSGCRNVCRRSESVINKEKTNNVKKGKLLSRCTPKDLLQAITSLNAPQLKKIDDLHWGDFLSIKIDAVESRDLYCWLLDRVDTSTMTLVISPDKVLPLSPVSVHNVMALPMGGGDLPKVRSKLVTEARKLLCSSLSLDSRTITIKRLLQEVAKGRIDDLSMKCFFMIAFNRLLFPTSSYDVSNNDILLSMDLEKIGSVDWCKVLIEDIKNAAIAWQNRDRNCTNPSIPGYAPYLLVYYLDQLDHPLNDSDRKSTPRAALFDRKKVEHLTINDKITDDNGHISYGALSFKSQVGSCYESVEGPSPPSNNLWSTECSSSSLVGDTTKKLSGRTSSVVQELVLNLDSKIQDQIHVIQSAQQSIVDHQLKFAEDLVNLVDTQNASHEDVFGHDLPLDADGQPSNNGQNSGDGSVADVGRQTSPHIDPQTVTSDASCAEMRHTSPMNDRQAISSDSPDHAHECQFICGSPPVIPDVHNAPFQDKISDRHQIGPNDDTFDPNGVFILFYEECDAAPTPIQSHCNLLLRISYHAYPYQPPNLNTDRFPFL
ncbi:hypothetical protein EJB05_53866, partial [Eragrostis curvula]